MKYIQPALFFTCIYLFEIGTSAAQQNTYKPPAAEPTPIELIATLNRITTHLFLEKSLTAQAFAEELANYMPVKCAMPLKHSAQQQCAATDSRNENYVISARPHHLYGHNSLIVNIAGHSLSRISPREIKLLTGWKYLKSDKCEINLTISDDKKIYTIFAKARAQEDENNGCIDNIKYIELHTHKYQSTPHINVK